MVLPLKFRSQTTALANYTYTDIASGTGMQTFYGYVSKTSTEQGTTDVLTYSLNQAIVFSKDIVTTWVTQDYGGKEANYEVDTTSKDFDLTQFNTPRIIEGTALIQNSWTGSRSNDTIDGKVKYILKKYDGTNETEIGSAFTPVESIDASVTPPLVALPITIAQVQFKKGEILRLSVEFWGKMLTGSGTGNVTFTFGTDPLDRDDAGNIITPSTETNETTQLIVHIPFKLDL